jgi:hypothetical protein
MDNDRWTLLVGVVLTMVFVLAMVGTRFLYPPEKR